MNKPLVMLCLGLTVLGPTLGGCRSRGGGEAAPGKTGPKAPPPPGTVATFRDRTITMEELQKPLIEAYGFNVLLNLVQLNAAEAHAQRKGVTITDADVQAETERTLLELARQNSDQQIAEMEMAEEKGDTAKAAELRKQLLAESEQLLDAFLAQKRLTRPEFDLSMRTNALLRKCVEPTIKGAITEKMIEEAFRFRYGEKVQVRHIQCRNWQEIGEVKKRLARGEDFAMVARMMSVNARTRDLGGELPAFSRQQTSAFGPAFVDTAFALKVGEVSDPVNTGGAFHLIKLERRIDPVAVKLEDHKEPLRRELHDAMLANGMSQLRQELFQAALRSLEVVDPILKAQYEKWTEEGKARVRGREEALKKMEQERQAAEAAAATQPGPSLTTSPTTLQAMPPMEATRPKAPATKPAPVPPTAPAGQ